MILLPVSCFCPGSALGRHLMRSDEERVGQSNYARSSKVAPLCNMQPDLIHRPGNGTLLRGLVSRPRTRDLLSLTRCSRRRFVGEKARPVGQHAMQHDDVLDNMANFGAVRMALRSLGQPGRRSGRYRQSPRCA